MTTAPTVLPPGPPALGLPPTRSTWPVVVGTIAIVFASLAIFQNGLCAPSGLLISRLMSGFMQDVAKSSPGTGMEVQAANLDALGRYAPQTLAIAGLATLVGILLLVGGIRLVRPRPKARSTIITWAVLKMMLAVPAAYVGYLSGHAQFEAMAEAAADQPSGPGQVPPGIFGILEGMGNIGAGLAVVWAWVLPIFMLIWFVRRPIVEEMREWTAPSPGLPDQAG